VLLLDEPLASIDAALRRSLRELILSIHDELQATTIYVTHDAHEAASIADRVIVLEEGRIRQEGLMSDLLADPKSLFVIQHASEVPFNLGTGELLSTPEGWQVRAADRIIGVKAVDGVPALHPGEIQFALHPDHVHISSGGDARVERSIREGGRTLLRVISNGMVWWVAEESVTSKQPVSIEPDLKHALFFNTEGQRLPLIALSVTE
jgi:ABC-type sugar transport system ATPase subunit